MSSPTSPVARVLLFGGGFALACALAAGLYFASREREDEAARVAREHAETVRTEVEPVRAAMEQAAAASGPYDIEATMRVVRELDLAVKHTSSLREYFESLRRTDYRRVAPEMIAARERILDVLVKYYGALERQEHEQELWQVFGRWSDELSKVLQASDVKATTPLGTISLSPSDPARQRVLAEERARREAQRTATFAELVRFEEELLAALDASVPVFREVEDEWARLCAQRDRAYLQAFELDFDAAAVSAQAALAMAPFDEESKLLLALTQIEGAAQVAPAGAAAERQVGVDELLASVLAENPDCAPALLLRGLWNVKRDRAAAARTDLELAMTRYPEQAERLRDVLDPYRSREYLRKTRQGGHITQLYRAMMLGANWFSPELQLARLELAQGHGPRALEHVKDHFARRRAQGQWDLVLYDLQFCEGLLGELYRDVFPEKSYLDLRIEQRTFGEAVEVTVDNRSDKTLHNAALVLAVRFTDMVEGEYEPFTVGKTQALVPANASTSFGALELEFDGLGTHKAFADVVPPIRAVLVCDEAVCWIDSIATKSERAASHGVLGGDPARRPTLSERLRGVLGGLGESNVTLERVKKLLTPDDLSIELPREIMLLGPLFRLEAGAESFDESSDGNVVHRIEGGKVRLTFEKVGKALDGSPEELRLVARSVLGEVRIVLRRNAQGNYVFSRVEGP
ncbi:MAG: hypothetical protein IT454_23520 [Planctomycetes bacterium]|nr:hypothetical protein [Planctomycetota bacterium]